MRQLTIIDRDLNFGNFGCSTQANGAINAFPSIRSFPADPDVDSRILLLAQIHSRKISYSHLP